MKKGTVQISPELLMRSKDMSELGYIESIHMDKGDDYAIAVIVGYQFPTINNGEDPPLCRVICHQERLRFEVEEV